MGGHHEKVGGHSKKIFPALRAGICAPTFKMLPAPLPGGVCPDTEIFVASEGARCTHRRGCIFRFWVLNGGDMGKGLGVQNVFYFSCVEI